MTDRECCPECGKVDIRRRVGRAYDASDDYQYRCRVCSARFDTPDHRDIERQAPKVEPARTLWLRGQEQEQEREESDE